MATAVQGGPVVEDPWRQEMNNLNAQIQQLAIENRLRARDDQNQIKTFALLMVIGLVFSGSLVVLNSNEQQYSNLPSKLNQSDQTRQELQQARQEVAELQDKMKLVKKLNPFVELNYIDTIVGSGSFDMNNNANNWDGSIQHAHTVNVKFEFISSSKGVDDGRGCLLLSGGYTGVHRIAKYCYDDKLLRPVAGDGIAGFSGDNGPAINARVNRPYEITTHPVTNDIYFCDRDNHRVRKIDFETNIIITFAGHGSNEYSGDNGLALNAAIGNPLSLVFDEDGSNLFVSHFDGNAIRKIDMSTNVITTIAGTGSRGYSGDGGLATSAQLNHPMGLRYDSSFAKMYFADHFNHRVRVIDMKSGIINTFAGTGQQGSSGDGGDANNAELNSPISVVFNQDGNKAYIAELNGHRIHIVDMKSNIIRTVAGTGVRGFNGDLQPARPAQLNVPGGLEIDDDGNLIVCDVQNNRVRRVWVN